MLKQLPGLLLPWFAEHRRDLPWRRDREPYHVWLSEIMLQQTRVEAVRGYYLRFLERLPDIAALASAPEDVLLKLWEGLGYYSRVRNLQKAAQCVMEQHGGEFPQELSAIRALPGIGDYTAGAIASICFEAPTAAVDGNVLRVILRLTACADSPADVRVLLSREANVKNKMAKSALKTTLKKFDSAVVAGNREEATAAYKAAVVAVDKAAVKGILHKNNAARKKSSMTLKLNAMA